MGRSFEAILKRRIADNERKRRKCAEDPEWREQRNARKRVANLSAEEKRKVKERSARRYQATKERADERRRSWTVRNRDRQNKTQRDNYARAGAERRAKIYAARDRRDPSRVIRRLTQALEDGSIGLDEFTAKVREQVDGFNRRMRERDGLGEGEDRGQASREPQNRASNPGGECAGSDRADPSEHGQGRG